MSNTSTGMKHFRCTKIPDVMGSIIYKRNYAFIYAFLTHSFPKLEYVLNAFLCNWTIEERFFLSFFVVSWLAGLVLILLKVLFLWVTSPFWSSPSTATLSSHSEKTLRLFTGERRSLRLQLSDELRPICECWCPPADTWGYDAGLNLGNSVNWDKGNFLRPGWIAAVFSQLKMV